MRRLHVVSMGRVGGDTGLGQEVYRAPPTGLLSSARHGIDGPDQKGVDRSRQTVAPAERNDLAVDEVGLDRTRAAVEACLLYTSPSPRDRS